jgi:phosphohistidine phosphatase
MELILVRHAKSEHDDYVPHDPLRHLSAKGYREAGERAKQWKGLGMPAGLLVSSPAIRALTTAQIFAMTLGTRTDRIRLSSDIYEAEVPSLMEVVASMPDDQPVVMMFGHNPGFTLLVNHLCGPVISHLPTAGLAHVRLDISSWEEAVQGSGRLLSFLD